MHRALKLPSSIYTPGFIALLLIGYLFVLSYYASQMTVWDLLTPVLLAGFALAATMLLDKERLWSLIGVFALLAGIAAMSLLSIADAAVSAKASRCDSTRLSVLRHVNRVETIGNTGCLFYTDHTAGFAYDPTGDLEDQGVFVFQGPDKSGIQKFRLDPVK